MKKGDEMLHNIFYNNLKKFKSFPKFAVCARYKTERCYIIGYLESEKEVHFLHGEPFGLRQTDIIQTLIQNKWESNMEMNFLHIGIGGNEVFNIIDMELSEKEETIYLILDEK